MACAVLRRGLEININSFHINHNLNGKWKKIKIFFSYLISACLKYRLQFNIFNRKTFSLHHWIFFKVLLTFPMFLITCAILYFVGVAVKRMSCWGISLNFAIYLPTYNNEWKFRWKFSVLPNLKLQFGIVSRIMKM